MFGKKNKRLRGLLSAILGILTAAACLPVLPAHAEISEPCTLRIRYCDEGTPIRDAAFRAYRVADYQDGYDYRLTDAFAGSQVTLKNPMENSEWVKAAETLAAYAKTSNIQADLSGKTDANGMLAFENISPSLYLIEGDALKSGSKTYTPQVFCAAAFDRGTDGKIVYDVTVEPKYESETSGKPGTHGGSSSSGGPTDGQGHTDLGNLAVSKTVTGTGDASREWHFRVTLGTQVSGEFGGMRFANGTAEFTLRHGESVTAEGIQAGTSYTVEELDANTDGYTTTVSGAQGTIPANGTAAAAFTNDHPDPNWPWNIPTTGDESPIELVLGIMFLSFMGILLFGVLGRKKKEPENKESGEP